MSGTRKVTSDSAGFNLSSYRGQWNYPPGMDRQRAPIAVGGLYHSTSHARGFGNSGTTSKWRRGYNWTIIVISGVTATIGATVTVIEAIRG